MGNFNSCIKPQNSSTNMAKLIDSHGKLKLILLPITVADIMLDYPGFALVLADHLRQTRRITAMKADEGLLGRKVYLLVPFDRVNSILTDSQMDVIDSIAIASSDRSCNKKKTRGNSKISPAEATGWSGDNLGELVKDLGGWSTGPTSQRKRFDRPWAPVLDPILEGCSC